MIEATCHCGAVKIEVPTAPTELLSCNCSICRRTGGLWSYYPFETVRVTGATVAYRWGDRTIDIRHCGTCGCMTHWSPVDPVENPRMGVNARLMDPTLIETVRVRRFDGANTWEFLD